MTEIQNQYHKMPKNIQAIAEEQQPSQGQEIKPRFKYKSILYGLGVAEVVFGCVSVLLAVVTLIIAFENPSFQISRSLYNTTHYYTEYYIHSWTYLSPGIWAGAFLIVTRILGICTKANSLRCLYNSNMAMSIVTANVMVPLMVLSFFTAANNAIWYYSPENRIYSLIAIHSILVVLGFCSAIVCIVHSAYCCAGVFCRSTSYHRSVVYDAQPDLGQQPQQMA